MSAEDFSKYFLPNLLALGSDPVPNVRITLAKALSYYYQTEGKVHLNIDKCHINSKFFYCCENCVCRSIEFKEAIAKCLGMI